jgi:hypothetical protein
LEGVGVFYDTLREDLEKVCIGEKEKKLTFVVGRGGNVADLVGLREGEGLDTCLEEESLGFLGVGVDEVDIRKGFWLSDGRRKEELVGLLIEKFVEVGCFWVEIKYSRDEN